MSFERYLEVMPDGRLIMYQENDGWTFLRRGSECESWEVKLNREKGCFESLSGNVFWYSYGCLFDAVRGLVRLGLMSFDEGVELLSRDRSFVRYVEWKYAERRRELDRKMKEYEAE